MTLQAPAADPGLPLMRLSVAQYHAMRDTGILGEEDRVELLEGLLVPKMTKNPPHVLATRLTRSTLETAIPSDHFVDSQEPITTLDSEPEPDVIVVRGAPRDFASRHPGPEVVALVVEIADDSVERDRVKQRLYARAGIATYWIVNLRSRAVEVYAEPRESGYATRTDYSSGSQVALIIAGREVARLAVDAMLP